jgi:hypothetical protein
LVLVHAALTNWGSPFCHERYLAHWLLQYGLLALAAAGFDDWRRAPAIEQADY